MPLCICSRICGPSRVIQAGTPHKRVILSRWGRAAHCNGWSVCACVCVRVRVGGERGERECGRVLGKGRGNSPAREAKLPLLFDGGMPSVRYVMA